ncbi:hypothetical protein MMC25_005009 [Agyrium rufum]|nr:hypothetical protein [Agyrium rufum]
MIRFLCLTLPVLLALAAGLVSAATTTSHSTSTPSHSTSLIKTSTAAASPSPTVTPPFTAPSSTPTSTVISSPVGSDSPSASGSQAPDVHLNVPNLSVGRIELDVDNLQADINLNAQIASLVTINAGVAVSIQKVNITIVDVEAQLELTVRLGQLVDIVNRVFQSLDLNPLLITALNDVTNVVDTVVGAVDSLLGTITQGGTTLSFIVDNLGNIVQEVSGGASSIVGNYLQNMTLTGVEQTLQNGLVSKQYSYSPLNALVDIVTNTAGQVVQATVEKASKGGTTTNTAPTSSSTAVKRR